ncbi:MAG: CHAD domain-containing protein [Nitrososphaera sp.]
MTRYSYYGKKFQKTLDRVNKRLVTFLKDPADAARIHNTRTSLRRLDAMFSLLPKKDRRINDGQIRKCKKFFKLSSSLRDADVIRTKIAALSPEARAMDVRLQRKRSAELLRVTKMARVFKPLRMRVDVRPDKLESRIDKITEKLSKRIRKNLPIVLSDSHKVEELHKLRIDCKRLRYVLETLPPSKAKKYQKRVAESLGKSRNAILLEELQDKLGDMHDSDITLRYLKRSKAKMAEELAAKEVSIREQLYKKLVRYARE